jgi:hypothetical protein
MKESDQIISSQAELETHILTLYESLYTRNEQVENNDEAREDCFQYLKQIVTDEHNAELLKPITIEEVATVLKQLLASKEPGSMQSQDKILACQEVLK